MKKWVPNILHFSIEFLNVETWINTPLRAIVQGKLAVWLSIFGQSDCCWWITVDGLGFLGHL